MGDLAEDKLEERIASKRHKELLETIKAIKLQPKDDSELKSLIHSSMMANEIFIKKIHELQKQELPNNEINVHTDHSEITETLKSIASQITQSNDMLMKKIDEMILESKRPKDFTMKMSRNERGMIHSVNGTVK